MFSAPSTATYDVAPLPESNVRDVKFLSVREKVATVINDPKENIENLNNQRVSQPVNVHPQSTSMQERAS